MFNPASHANLRKCDIDYGVYPIVSYRAVEKYAIRIDVWIGNFVDDRYFS